MDDADNSVTQGSGRAVKDYTSYNEKDREPSLNKTIRELIDSNDNYIVYLDEDLAVEWSFNDSYGETPEGFGDVANEIGDLEALSEVMLAKRQLRAFRRLLAEAMARILGDHDENGAKENLRAARSFLFDRGLERKRSLYLITAFIATVTACLTAWLIWHWRSEVTQAVGLDGLQVSIGAMFGAVGALVFILGRLPQIEMNAAAGPLIHCLESAARVVTGMLGSLLVALAVKANIVLGLTQSSGHEFAFLLAICIVGGSSERLVPSIIERMEDSVVGNHAHGQKTPKHGA